MMLKICPRPSGRHDQQNHARQKRSGGFLDCDIEPLPESLVLYLAACSSVGAWLVTDKCSLPVTDSVDSPLAHNSGPIQRLHNLLKRALLLSMMSECQTWPGRPKLAASQCSALCDRQMYFALHKWCPQSPCAQGWVRLRPSQSLTILSRDRSCQGCRESVSFVAMPRTHTSSLQRLDA